MEGSDSEVISEEVTNVVEMLLCFEITFAINHNEFSTFEYCTWCYRIYVW